MGSTTPSTPGARRFGAAALAAVLGLTTLAALAGPTATGAPVVLGTSAPVAAAEEGAADWTMMIYDVADTDISEIMVANLAQFAAIEDMDNVNIVALVDLPERNQPYYPRSTLPGVEPFTTAKLLVLDGGRWNEVRDYGEVAMGRPDVLATFIEEAAGRFPADKYGLILSDHGSAYAGGYIDDGPPVASRLKVSDMRDGIAAGLQRAGIDRFEMINHDSCLMASYEATSALAPLTSWLVASEEITFGDTTLSTRAMQLLGEDISGEEWGVANSDDYAAYADSDPYGDGKGVFTAVSVFDAERGAPLLDQAVESFVDVVVPRMEELAPAIARARNNSLEFVTDFEGGNDPGFHVVDLGDFMRQLGDEIPADVAVARDAVFEALDAAVTYQVNRQATQEATGLNVFVPKSAESAQRYLDRNYGTPAWTRFVQAYSDAAELTGDGGQGTGDDAVEFISDEAEVLEIGPGGIRIAGQLGEGDAARVAETQTQVLAEIDGRTAVVSVLPAYLNSGGPDRVQGVWNFAITTLVSGDTRAPASAFYQAQSGGLVGAFRASYTTAGGHTTDVIVRLLLSSEGQIESLTVVDAADQNASGPVVLEPGGTLTPYLVTLSSGTAQLELSSTAVPTGPELTVRYPKLPAGTRFEMGLGATDVAGNTDFTSVNETTR